MAQTATPYGLRPVKRADGLPYAGAQNQYITDPAGYGTNMFYGQVVNLNANGHIVLTTGTGADGTTNSFPGSGTLTGSLGVFVGCEYINAEGQLIFSQRYPANTLNAKIYVVDDPQVLFQGQLDGTGAQTIIGANTFFAAAQSGSTGNLQTGVSTSALESTVVTTTAAFRVMAHVSPPSDPFPDVLVKFNPGYHSLTNAVGL